MKTYTTLLIALFLFVACKKEEKPPVRTLITWETYDEKAEISDQGQHENSRMRYKLIQSRFSDRNDLWKPFEKELTTFSDEEYERLKPLILEQDILTIQRSISEGKLSYEQLTLFYLYRIYLFESDPDKSLHSVIALNPDVLVEARARDKELKSLDIRHPVYGMPILLKDNIGTDGIPTTAGAVALKDNMASDAFIVTKLKKHGALILGKVNLSEWAYFFCSGCPLGYSAIGGQTLNPYGRKVFESGGSSAASGTTIAANYAVAAVGTETSGSILSPSSQNSVVGLKPTIGLLSRTGIVPISSTLDTPGPMTKNVTDNSVLLDAMFGFDSYDTASKDTGLANGHFYRLDDHSGLKGKRFGVFKGLIESDSIYKMTVEKIKAEGAEIVEFDPPQVQLTGFLTLLNIDMKHDLPAYLKTQAGDKVTVRSVADVVAFNLNDTINRAPYGQQLFEGIVADSTTLEELAVIKDSLQLKGRLYFDTPVNEHQLDAVLSINNYHAGFAAVAKYPALTVPMGYKESGEPISLTFIGRPFGEKKLYQLGHAFEQATKLRQIPEGYE